MDSYKGFEVFCSGSAHPQSTVVIAGVPAVGYSRIGELRKHARPIWGPMQRPEQGWLSMSVDVVSSRERRDLEMFKQQHADLDPTEALRQWFIEVRRPSKPRTSTARTKVIGEDGTYLGNMGSPAADGVAARYVNLEIECQWCGLNWKRHQVDVDEKLDREWTGGGRHLTLRRLIADF